MDYREPLGAGQFPANAAQSANGTVCAICGAGPCAVWKNGTLLPPLPAERRTETLALSTDGTRLATVSVTGQVYSAVVWSITNAGTAPALLHEFPFPARKMAFNPDARWLALGSNAENAVVDLTSSGIAARWSAVRGGVTFSARSFVRTQLGSYFIRVLRVF